MENAQEIQELVEDLQRRGYSKYKSTIEVKVEYELTYEQAYYRVRKFWKKPFITQDGNKI